MTRPEPTVPGYLRRWIAGVVVLALLLVAVVLVGQPRDPRVMAHAARDHLALVDAASAEGRFADAARLWTDARSLASESRDWEVLVETGDAYRRLGRAGGFGPRADAQARQVYLDALFAARGRHSVEGVLAAADAFASLGDRDVVENALGIARTFSAGATDPAVTGRVQEVAGRLRERALAPRSASGS
jgi:hypothetical protein